VERDETFVKLHP